MSTLKGLRRWAALGTTAIALALGLVAPAAQASNTIRSFTPRYQVTGRVVSYLVGNQLLNCPAGVGTCDTVRNGTGNNNDHVMQYVDVDGDASTFDSSTATLTFPAGATVQKAFLYWGADTSAGTGTGATAAPAPASRNVVKFATPAGFGYQSITAAQTDVTGNRYTAVADVTTLVTAGGTGVYGVADVQAGTGADRYGGWSLVVIFKDSTAPLRSATLFDGALNINTTAPTQITTTVSGFRTPATGVVGARIGLVAFEGDNNFAGDQFQVNGTQISDALNPATNVFNSTNTRLGVAQTGRSPQQSNMFGFDIDYLAVNEGIIANNATSANLTFTTTSETYFPVALLFVTNVYEPEIVTNFTKSLVDLNGGTVRPGDVLEYTVNVSNTGDDTSDTTVVTDALPAGVTYVPGSIQILGINAGAKTDAAGDDQADYNSGSRTLSFRLGTGANASAGGSLLPVTAGGTQQTIKFRVTVNPAADGTSVANVAGISYVGQTTGVPGTGTTPPSTFTITSEADLAIQFAPGYGGTPQQGGAPTSYSFVVTNNGPADANNATVAHDVPNGITNVVITCVPSNGAVCPSTSGLSDLNNLAIPTFPNGGSVTFQVTGTMPSTGPLNLAAKVDSSPTTSDPDTSNNIANDTASIIPPTDLAVTNTPGASSYTAGQNATFTLTVTNNGPAAATNAVLSETLPAGLTFVSISGPAGWSITTPAVGAGGTITATNASLPAGTTATFTLVATIDSSVANGTTVAATATTSTDTYETNAANNAATATFTVTGGADVSIIKTLTTAGPYREGQSIAYTLVVSNAGPATATNVQVTDTPTNLSNIVVSGAGCSALPCTIASLASGANATINVTATITAAGAFDNTANVTATESDPTPGNNGDSTGNGGTAAPSADLAVTNVLTSPATAPAGSQVTYTITVTNNGPSAVTGATLTETMPSQLTGVTWTCASGCATSSGTGDLNTTINVAVNGTVTVLVTGTAPSTTPATVSAPTATVTPPSSTVDPAPANNSATASPVTITALPIDAINDAGSTGGATTATAIANVLANDTLNSAPATTGTVTLSVVTPASNTNVALNTATGAVTVAAGTPSGTYTITYRICETANATNCDTAVATVTVTSAALVANNDAGTANGQTGGNAVANVLGNDTLNGGGATLANTTVSQVSTSNPNVTLNPSTGAVNVAPGTPAGTYTLVYRMCEAINPTNCQDATVTVTVTAAPIVANDDAPPAIVGSTGGPAIANVLVNDTLGGTTATTSTVTLTQQSTSNPNVTLDPATGAVNVAAGTPAGTYTLTYQACEKLNPANCDTAVVTVVVSAAVIDAVNDTTPPVNGVAGGTAINVLGNDTLGGGAATTSTVTLTQVSTSNPAITLDPATGAVNVAPGTPAGTYTLTYTICEQLNPTNCDTATVTVNVVAPALAATNDTGTTTQNTAVAVSVLTNDTMAGAPVVATAVVVTVTTSPTHGTAVVNANGTVTYTPATNYSGTDSFVYTICDVVNPTVCSSATANLTVTPNTVDAIDTAVTSPQTGPVVINPMTTTTNGGGAPLDPGSVQVVAPPSNGTAVVNPNGTITYTPNPTFFGTETFTYRICDRSTPTPVCDVARVTITVAMQAPQLRLTKTVPSRSVKVGDLVRYTVVVENTGVSPADNATVVDVPPQGFTFVEGSLAVDDADDRFVLAGADPIRVNGIDVPVGGRATITYVLRVGAGVGRGTHTNTVSATDATGTSVSNTATADVTVEGDPTMDDTLILGTVFVDRNGDGVQQADEPGLPGVRLASVEGLVIETDVHGRYHVAGVQPANAMRGSNFVLKVDAATLPPGATFTTSNPLVRRITPGIPVRFDFGVTLPSGSDATGTATR